MSDVGEEMVKEFQCPGCVSGPFEECFEKANHSSACKNHFPGMDVYPNVGTINLGLPKGFNRVGYPPAEEQKGCFIRLYESWEEKLSIEKYGYDNFNVPVWAMEKDGYLFVRVYSPRINMTYVDVIKDGKLENLPPKTINVAEFVNDMD